MTDDCDYSDTIPRNRRSSLAGSNLDFCLEEEKPTPPANSLSVDILNVTTC
jgi:hypothetical protein